MMGGGGEGGGLGVRGIWGGRKGGYRGGGGGVWVGEGNMGGLWWGRKGGL